MSAAGRPRESHIVVTGLRGEYFPLLYSRKAVDEAAERKMILQPEQLEPLGDTS